MAVLLKQQQKFSTDRGFTLIELMLVILVVGLISVYAVQLINQSIVRSQINRAAAQIVNIKQACTNYYTNKPGVDPTHGKWPPDLQTLVDKGFLPTNGLCSPFAGTTTSSTCAHYAQYDYIPPSTNANYLQLTLTVPSISLAQQLVAAVPNSWITTGSTVNIAITPPVDLGLQRNHGWIVSAGVIGVYSNYTGFMGALGPHNDDTMDTSSYGTALYLPTCPKPFEGHILYFPLNYQTNTPYWNMHIEQMPIGNDGNQDSSLPGSASSSIVYQYNSGGIDRHGNTIYAASVGDDAGAGATSMNHLVNFITVCLPPPENSSQSHWATYALNAKFLQDGQCATGVSPDSWKLGSNGEGYNTNTLDCNQEPASPIIQLGGYPPVGSPDAY